MNRVELIVANGENAYYEQLFLLLQEFQKSSAAEVSFEGGKGFMYLWFPHSIKNIYFLLRIEDYVLVAKEKSMLKCKQLEFEQFIQSDKAVKYLVASFALVLSNMCISSHIGPNYCSVLWSACLKEVGIRLYWSGLMIKNWNIYICILVQCCLCRLCFTCR